MGLLGSKHIAFIYLKNGEPSVEYSGDLMNKIMSVMQQGI